MESFERYAGFFPDAALSMMEREDRDRSASRFHTPANPEGLMTLSLANGVWADAILPEVMDYLPHASAPDTRRTRDTFGNMVRRLRLALSRA